MSSSVDNLPPVPSQGEYNTQWSGILGHLKDLVDDGKIFEAVEYIASSLFLFLSGFTEDFQMGKQAVIERYLSALGDARNKVEQDFDANQVSGGDAEKAKEAEDQYYGKDGIKAILEQGEKAGIFTSSFVKEVEGEFTNTIFYGADSAHDGKGLATQWAKDWANTTLSPSPGTNKNASLQAVTNSLTAVSNDFSSQSSTAQSKLKYYESNDEQYKSIFHDIATDWINVMKSMITAMQSASN